MSKGSDALIVLVDKLSKSHPDIEDKPGLFDVMNVLANITDEEFDDIVNKSKPNE